VTSLRELLGIKISQTGYEYSSDGHRIGTFGSAFVPGRPDIIWQGDFLEYDAEYFRNRTEYEAWLAEMIRREFKPALSVIMQAGLLPKPLRERADIPYKIEYPIHHGDVDCE